MLSFSVLAMGTDKLPNNGVTGNIIPVRMTGVSSFLKVNKLFSFPMEERKESIHRPIQQCMCMLSIC